MKKISLVEVGPRDGLQNESSLVSISDRLEFAKKLDAAGIRRLELGAFVSPQWVPQMAGSDVLIAKALELQKKRQLSRNLQISALVPNRRGLEEALKVGLKEVAVFAACSETFSQKNTNCTIAESFARISEVMAVAKKNKVRVRGYLSTCFGCPYEGFVAEKKVVELALKLFRLGVFELSIGDTIGVAHPKQVRSLLKKLFKRIPSRRIAMHFHDTRGTALANILAAVDLGVRTFDSSLGGLGGCPYAPGASGNVATEDVIYLLQGMGYHTGVDLVQLLSINQWMSSRVQRKLPSRLGAAGLPKAGLRS